MPTASQPFESLRRFHCPGLPHPRLSERHATLDPDQSRHARKVLRLKPGDPLELFDGQGLTARATVEAYHEGLAVCRVEGVTQTEPPRPWITVATAIPKGPRADEMVNLLSQLGCDRLVPTLTARSEVDPRDAKLEKWARVAVESAKQSHRAFIMQVDRPRPLTDVIRDEGARSDVKLIAAIGGAGAESLAGRLRTAGSVTVLIGPAGDWTDEELAAARDAGFSPWSLGPNVLRVETAAAAATAVLRYLAQG